MSKTATMLSFAEENYIKAVHHIAESRSGPVSTNELADALQTKAASVTDMVKKLAKKGLLIHVKYQGVTITEEGNKVALHIIRKHRLWETFLVRKLGFKWNEVHEVAEQLEHIRSPLLIKRLDKFLDYPKVDPHGDPIPDSDGRMVNLKSIALKELETGCTSTVVSASDSSDVFLKYLDQIKINLGSRVRIMERYDYDGSMMLKVDNHNPVAISEKVAENLFVNPE